MASLRVLTAILEEVPNGEEAKMRSRQQMLCNMGAARLALAMAACEHYVTRAAIVVPPLAALVSSGAERGLGPALHARGKPPRLAACSQRLTPPLSGKLAARPHDLERKKGTQPHP